MKITIGKYNAWIKLVTWTSLIPSLFLLFYGLINKHFPVNACLSGCLLNLLTILTDIFWLKKMKNINIFLLFMKIYIIKITTIFFGIYYIIAYDMNIALALTSYFISNLLYQFNKTSISNEIELTFKE